MPCSVLELTRKAVRDPDASLGPLAGAVVVGGRLQAFGPTLAHSATAVPLSVLTGTAAQHSDVGSPR